MTRVLKFLLLVAVVFGAAFALQALRDTSGEVAVTIGDTVYAVDLTVAAIAAIVLVLVVMGVLWFLGGIVRAPWRMAAGWRQRRRELGRDAVAHGLVAIAAGDSRAAERAMLEAVRRAPGEPLTRLLQAQTAQLKGNRAAARAIFEDMVGDAETRVAGLRGLYIEAEREGQSDAARRIAERARQEAPSAPWAARALLQHQSGAADWDEALATLSGAVDGGVVDKRTARRQRAVLLTAKALSLEEGDPDTARQAAQEAHDLATDLVPAAVAAGRLFAREGDIRRATRVLEAAWKAGPHPEIAEEYLHVRSGDSAIDRLKRAEALLRMRPLADEGRHAVARAAIDAREFRRAREALEPILARHPTRKALVLMAELEQAETGDSGRARGWLARAAYAPRDPAWMADGTMLEEWAPVSPLSGRLDAVEWKVPLTEIEGPRLDILPEPPASGAATALPVPAASHPVEPGGRSVSSQRISDAAAKPQSAPAGAGKPEAAAIPAAIPLAVPLQVQPTAAPLEPPSPDDPGVGGEEEEERRGLPAFLRSG